MPGKPGWGSWTRLSNGMKVLRISNGTQYAADRNGWNSLDIPKGVDKIARSLGGMVAGSAELGGGKISKTMKLDMGDRSVVVKISPLWFDHSLARERWCYEKLKETGVLTPKVFEYFPSQNDIFPGHEIIVREFVEGPLLSEVQRDAALHKNIGDVYRRIHSIPLRGYGWLDESFNGKKGRWIDFLKDVDKAEVGIEYGMVKRSEYGWLLGEFDRRLDREFAPKLLHADFRWENFVLGPKGIVAIDFQNAFSGHELYDYGIGAVYDPGMTKNLKYYFGQGIGEDVIRPVLLYGMRDAVGTAGFLASRGDIEYAKYFRNRFDDLKREYDSL